MEQLKRGINVLSLLPKDVKAKYLKHVKESGQVEGHEVSDLAFIPRKYFSEVTRAIDQIEKLDPDLLSEVGMPLAFNLVAPGEERVYLRAEHLYMRERMDMKALGHLADTCDFFHPVKLTTPKHRNLFRALMAGQYKNMTSS